MNLTYLKTDSRDVNTAYYTAISDVVANIQPMHSSFCGGEIPVLMAGIGYSSPWTRDAAINTINAAAYLIPDIAKNTLLSVLEQRNGRTYIGGEYWDAIIWVWGAWELYRAAGDKDFLHIAYDAAVNSLEFFEKTEFDPGDNLFRGAACYGDGVSAYPDIYATPGESGIMDFAEQCRNLCVKNGVGIPMKALSTNCLYYYAYILADKMADELGASPRYAAKAAKLKQAINGEFRNGEKGYYNYLKDPFGGCDAFEGLGNAFAVLFGIAEGERARRVFENAPLTPYGIACLYPSFARYGSEYGRHSGTVWPHVQSFWADAAAKNGRFDLAMAEFRHLTAAACRDGFFAEIYHPVTGEIYGGVQECEKQGISLWKSEIKQTWSATGYLHIIFADILGMSIGADGVYFRPRLPEEISRLELSGLMLRGMTFNIDIAAKSGRSAAEPTFVPFGTGEKSIRITL